jgi:hypothetical protein
MGRRQKAIPHTAGAINGPRQNLVLLVHVGCSSERDQKFTEGT